MRQATRAQWIKCAIAIILYLAFLIWVRSWWGLIVVPFIFDIYITKRYLGHSGKSLRIRQYVVL